MKRLLIVLLAIAAMLSMYKAVSASHLPAGRGGRPDAGAGGSAVRGVQQSTPEFLSGQAVSHAAVFFAGARAGGKRIPGAVEAAGYLEGQILAPGDEAYIASVPGKKYSTEGFVSGINTWGGPVTGGRASAALSGAPAGGGRGVSRGGGRLRFKNTGATPMAIHSRVMETNVGSILLAEMREQKPLTRLKAAVLREPPGSCLWEKVSHDRMDILERDGVTYISSRQLGELLGITFFTEVHNGVVSVSTYAGGRLAKFKEGSVKASVGGSGWTLAGSPFRLPGAAQDFWLPLEDWARITGAEALKLDKPDPLALFNVSGTSVAGREELKPGWRAAGKAGPYGYTELARDLDVLARMYPGIKLTVLGQSALGRDIPLVKMGSGPVEVFISGAWHGDEYITAAFLARFIEETCRTSTDPAIASLLGRITLYIAPMINPDGCEVAAHASRLPEPLAVAAAALSPPGFDLSRWRANLQGVDLNKQFPVQWETVKKMLLHNELPRGRAGDQPLSAPESRAAYDFTIRHSFAAVFCYHSQGEVLYWRLPEGDETAAMSAVTDLYSRESGYTPISSTDLSGGYRDWYAATYRRPALTVEVGRGINPLPPQQIDSIWNRNYPALTRCLQALAENN